jgi:hypothetical protein
MCDLDDPLDPVESAHRTLDGSSELTRRDFLGGAVGVVGAVGLGLPFGAGDIAAAESSSLAPVSNSAGEVARTMAMHIHSSFSEGVGSMEAQLAEAARSGVDVLWWSDHDWRMAAAGYRTAVHFDSLAGEQEAGRAWQWRAATNGSAAAVSGGIVSSPVSPKDPSAVAGALRVSCVSAGTAAASYRFLADTGGSRLNARSNLAGLRLGLEVLTQQAGPDAWLELLLQLSRRPAAPGRSPVPYQLSYRFGPGPRGYQVAGTNGTVWVPVTTGAWTSVQLVPAQDVAALWPDIQATDNALFQLWLGATSRNGAASSGCFDYLTFHRDVVGAAAMASQRQLMGYYSGRYASVLQIQALEVSYYNEHLNWYGGSPAIPDSSTWTQAYPKSKTPPYVLAAQQATLIHAGGGLASLNHPFGTGTGTGAGADVRHKIVSGLQAARPALDVIEVGYASRGADLRGHLDLWDTLLSNGWLLTGSGVSDDHQGEVGTWTKMRNRFATGAWTVHLNETSLVSALAGGRAYCRELGTTPSLDLTVGGTARMGQVLVDPAASSQLDVQATALPAGSSVRVVQGSVDFAGTALDPTSATVATIAGSAFGAGGTASVVLDTKQSTFARVEVADTTGRIIAFSNPVWVLRQPPPGGVPADRVPV